jgi:ATP-dependent 26S proteasome regulatory subunit
LITFLNKVDGVDGESRDSILVLGVINWPWTLDVALLRPGRFDRIILRPNSFVFEGQQRVENG